MRKTNSFVDGRQVVEPTVWDVVVNRDPTNTEIAMRGRIVKIEGHLVIVSTDEGEDYETAMDNLYLDAMGWTWLLHSEDPVTEVGW